jgi:hypothetical protein
MTIRVCGDDLLARPAPSAQPQTQSRGNQQLTRYRNAGGKKILQRVAGKDASKQFWKYHNEGILKKYHKQLHVGSLDTKPKAAAPPPPAPAPKKEAPKPKPAAAAAAAPAEDAEALEPFGQQIPFSDPAWYQGVSHRLRFRGNMWVWVCVT